MSGYILTPTAQEDLIEDRPALFWPMRDFLNRL